MGLIKNDQRYTYDTNISNEDRLVGTDADNSEKTKSYSIGELVAYISTQVDGVDSNNLFTEIDLGSMQEGESIAAVANSLPQYQITDTVLPIYKVLVTQRGSTLEQEKLYVTLLNGKGTYGVGGDITLSDSDFFNINPIQLETIRNSLVIESLIGANQLISGNVTYSGIGMNFVSNRIDYIIGGTFYVAEPDESITLSNGGAQPRIDVIAVDTEGNVVVIEGTEAPNPIEPTLDDYSTQLKVAIVTVSAGATTPNGVIVEKIYDENTGEPNEWNITENTVGARLITDSTSYPYINTFSIRGVNLLSGDNIFFVKDSVVNTDDYVHLSFRVKLDSGLSNNFGGKVYLSNSGTQIVGSVLLENSSYGFDTSNLSDYQLIVIPMSEFTIRGLDFDTVGISFEGVTGSEQFHIDDIKLVGGVDEVNGFSIPERTSELINDGEDGINPFITLDDVLNMYNSNGTIDANRIVTISDEQSLTFSGATVNSTVSFDVGIFNVESPDIRFKVDSLANQIVMPDASKMSIIADNGLLLDLDTTPTANDVLSSTDGAGNLTWRTIAEPGLQLVNDGSGEAYRLANNDGSFTGNIGLNSVDFGSYSLTNHLYSVSIATAGDYTGISDGVYRATQFSTSGLGTGGEFDITVAANALSSVDIIQLRGKGYEVGDTITIDVYGQSEVTRATLNVTGVSESGVMSEASFTALSDNSLPTTSTGSGNFGSHIAVGYGNLVQGYYNNLAFGTYNKIYNGYSFFTAGYSNYADMTPTVGQGASIGLFNESYNYWNNTIGVRLHNNSKGTTLVGMANEPWSGSPTAGGRPAFAVGTGTVSDSTANYGTVISRRNSFAVYFDGTAQLHQYGIGSNKGNSAYGLGVDSNGNIIETDLYNSAVPVASLPAGTTGQRFFVTDANATTFNSVVAGGGANFVPVFFDGTDWKIG